MNVNTAQNNGLEQKAEESCCCGPKNHEIKTFREVKIPGKINTTTGEIGIVTNQWSFSDYLGAIMVRLGFCRMNYAVKPGLYAVGKPGSDSPVFVSANYKLSFDILRKDLAGISGWILVIDTKGVNVWCAAGKGTFGTKEIAGRIASTGLSEAVSHRDIIVPQLGAPGVSAFKVMLFSGFKVIFGPVRSSDIKAFMKNGMKADTEMRTVKFGLKDRLVVSVIELTMAVEKLFPAAVLLIIVYALFAGHFSLGAGLKKSLFPLFALFLSAITGTIFTAGLLPFIPGKAFSIKGAFLGFIVSTGALLLIKGPQVLSVKNFCFVIFVSALSAFFALNFTGSSTFTSLSGVKKEVRLSLPVIIAVMLASVITFAWKCQK